jgi:hypothetical protein
MLQEVYELISEIINQQLIDKPYKGEQEIIYDKENYNAKWYTKS